MSERITSPIMKVRIVTRAKRDIGTITKGTVMVQYIDLIDNTGLRIFCPDIDYKNYTVVKLSRFTGKYDKCGTEIYEHDKVKINWKDDNYRIQYATVSWDADNCCWNFGAGSVREVHWSHEVLQRDWSSKQQGFPKGSIAEQIMSKIEED